MRLYSSLILALLTSVAATTPLRAADDPLAYVTSNSGVFAHVRFGDLWNRAIGQDIRKAAGKDIDLMFGEFEKNVGIPIDIVDTATFFYPTFPQGAGDQVTFIVVATTTKPFDRDTLLQKLRKKDSKQAGNLIELEEKFALYIVSDTMFVVMHQSFVDKYSKGPPRDEKPGVMSDAIKLARDKHQFVLSMDFSKLPNELFTAAPPQLQPFLPLLKSKSGVLFADLKDKDLSVKLNFVGENANAAEDSEHSFKLLMKLASDGLADVLKEDGAKKDVLPFVPSLKELERGVKNIKAVREGARLETTLAFKIDQPVGKLVAEYAKNARDSSSRSVAQNNLKQISLAMHNYNSQYNGFPPAAICDKKGKPLLSWRVAILPYVDQDTLYKQFKLDEPWDSDHNKKLVEQMPKVYGLPGAKADGNTNYRIFHSNGAAFDLIQPVRIQDIADGTSNTVMIVETADATPWTKPDDIEFDDKLPIEKLLRFVNDRTNVAMFDGSVRTLKKGLGDKTWRLLIQRADGMPIPKLEE